MRTYLIVARERTVGLADENIRALVAHARWTFLIGNIPRPIVSDANRWMLLATKRRLVRAMHTYCRRQQTCERSAVRGHVLAETFGSTSAWYAPEFRAHATSESNPGVCQSLRTSRGPSDDGPAGHPPAIASYPTTPTVELLECRTFSPLATSNTLLPGSARASARPRTTYGVQMDDAGRGVSIGGRGDAGKRRRWWWWLSREASLLPASVWSGR
ncbi:hypothetical protein C8Q80DRAFT_689979 [Daedaleopsis nitida]|nr:hypothetical protein C8Q80DRAFT_689979 [Daedaleopsis nitida]